MRKTTKRKMKRTYKKRTYKKRTIKKRTIKKRTYKKGTRKMRGGDLEKITKNEIQSIITNLNLSTIENSEIYKNKIFDKCVDTIIDYLYRTYKSPNTILKKSTKQGEKSLNIYNTENIGDTDFIEFVDEDGIMFEEGGIHVLYYKNDVPPNGIEKTYIKKEDIPYIWPSEWEDYFPSYDAYLEIMSGDVQGRMGKLLKFIENVPNRPPKTALEPETVTAPVSAPLSEPVTALDSEHVSAPINEMGEYIELGNNELDENEE